MTQNEYNEAKDILEEIEDLRKDISFLQDFDRKALYEKQETEEDIQNLVKLMLKDKGGQLVLKAVIDDMIWTTHAQIERLKKQFAEL